MGIRLIGEDEQLKYFIGSDSWIFYRRVPRGVRERLAAKHRKRGIIEDGAYNYALIEYAITGWGGNVKDQHGNPFPYTQDKMPTFLKGLPEDVYMGILEKVNAADAEFEGELKNSGSGLSAAPS